jgi:hypothetical protein
MKKKAEQIHLAVMRLNSRSLTRVGDENEVGEVLDLELHLSFHELLLSVLFGLQMHTHQRTM